MPDARTALPDVNVLVALTNPAHVHHERAHRWLKGVAAFATTPITESGLLRLLLNSAVVGQDVTGEQALTVVRRLRADPRCSFLPDEATLADPSVDLIGLAGYRHVTDFHLANLAAAHGAVLVTFDRRIPGMLVGDDRRYVHVLT